MKILTITLFLSLFCQIQLLSCSMPVFRYSLHNWATDRYKITVFNDQPFKVEEQKLFEELQAKALNPDINIVVENIAKSRMSSEQFVMLKKQGMDKYPCFVVQYPSSKAGKGVIWVAEFVEKSLEMVLTSPVRSSLHDELGAGSAAVWLLLKNGDDGIENRVKTMLDELEKSIVLPEGHEEYGVDFKLINISADSAKEKFFLNMMLKSENDLHELLKQKKPMLFPIYGRGRLLYTLVGKGINRENVTSACKFVTGECSCEVKDQNPGVDLLISGNWESIIEPTLLSEEELPPLTGVILTDPQQVDQPKLDDNKVADSAGDDEEKKLFGLQGIFVLLLLLTGLIVVATIIILRRKQF